jgi:hypothetical protein
MATPCSLGSAQRGPCPQGTGAIGAIPRTDPLRHVAGAARRLGLLDDRTSQLAATTVQSAHSTAETGAIRLRSGVLRDARFMPIPRRK